MITLDNLYKLRQLSSSYKGSLGLLIDLLSAGRTQNLNFFDLLRRNPVRALQEYEKIYKEDFLGFADSFSDLIEGQFSQYRYLNDIVSHIDEYFSKLDLELSSTTEDSIDFAHLEHEYFAKLDTLFWGLVEILRILSEHELEQEVPVSTREFSSEKIDRVNEALRDGRLEMYGQKIYKNSREIVDIELLARLVGKDGVVLTPDEFLPIIEHTGRVSEFDWLVLEEAFRYIGKNIKKVTFSLNVNPVTFQQADFIEKMKALVQRHGINARYIVLEVLEYGSIQDTESIDAIFGELQDFGFKIAIDDYPSGYNTLAFVTRFKNIDIIKVDGMHVVNMYKTCHSCDNIDTCIQPFLREVRVADKGHCLRRLDEKYDLESLMRSFQFLKILYPKIIFFAERIESEDIFDFFAKIPELITGYQGYYFQRPEPFTRTYACILDGTCLSVSSFDFVDRRREVAPHMISHKKQIETIPQSVFFDHMVGLEKFCFSIVELEPRVHSEDLTYSLGLSEGFFGLIRDAMQFLNVNAMNFYYVSGDEVLNKKITLEGEVELISLPLLSRERTSMVEKQFANFFSLYHGQKDISHGGYDISYIPVQNLGDDIVVKISPEFYIGIDDMENARTFNKQIQVSLFTLLATEIGRIYQKNR